jgi:chromosome segregation protein
LAARRRQNEVDRVTWNRDLDRIARERTQQAERRAALGAVRTDGERAVEDNSAREQSLRKALGEASEAAERQQTQALGLRDAAEAASNRVDVLVVDLTALKIGASQAGDRVREAQGTLERLRRDREQEGERHGRLQAQTTEDVARADALRVRAVDLKEEASRAQADATACARLHAEKQDAVEARHAALSRREADLRAARTQLAELGQRLGSLDLRCQEVRLRRMSVEEQVEGRYTNVRLPDVVSEYHLRPPASSEQEARVQDLRRQIERMGEINLTAIEEAEALKTRCEFLTQQHADLESAMALLTAAIDKIKRASRRRFREAFDAINERFQEVFPRMFGGGRAFLQLTNEDDLLETGVDIVAHPPGKKVFENIDLMSGGEKALTAVSLLFAIFLVKPSPYCVLDEVDAPLDEANLGRFNQAVRDMTDRSQFILVSHSRRTMENADRLCGVTMEEPGVSKLVAVNLRAVRREGTTSVPVVPSEAVAAAAVA